ncbi:hypothetical protein EDB19DRAFT_597097 [Suillus lakei]|nr:hypothetical protein EDB19DRAFT_597097 [Suillus lakei]
MNPRCTKWTQTTFLLTSMTSGVPLHGLWLAWQVGQRCGFSAPSWSTDDLFACRFNKTKALSHTFIELSSDR